MTRFLHIDCLFLGITEFQKPVKDYVEEVFAEKQLRFDTYCLLLVKAVDAWEKDSLEIDYLKDELDEFDYLLRNYWEDYIKRSRWELGCVRDEAFDDLCNSRGKQNEDDKVLAEKEKEWITILYDEVMYWVVKASLNLKEIEFD